MKRQQFHQCSKPRCWASILLSEDRQAGCSSKRNGFTLLDASIAGLVLLLLVLVALPVLGRVRESARRQTCAHRIRNLTLALHSYHNVYKTLPPAAVWSVDATASLALHDSKQIDRITHENWAQLLLPFLDRPEVAQRIDLSMPIGADENAAVRLTSLPEMSCPSDGYNRVDNPYEFRISEEEEPRRFARGNYGINGGTQNTQVEPPSTAYARGETTHLAMEDNPRRYQMWGNGIAGINTSFALDDFSNGRSTLVALEELRTGVHALDPRGVWALGQIGGSLTWAHGVQGDASQPNIQFYRSDDVYGCGRLHAAFGTQQLEESGMPCCHYVDRNAQAAARSQHPGGVNVAFVDGSVRFISDTIDPGIWHVMHSRETPADILAEQFEERLLVANFPDAGPGQQTTAPDINDQEMPFENSVGMKFIQISDGEFQMGVPDIGNDFDPPPECPEHLVRITSPYCLSIHEVTQQQFRTVMGDDSVQNKAAHGSDSANEQFPIVNVTWDAAVEFCQRLSQRPQEISAGRSFRLPTEAEWEFACRGGTSQPYHWKENRDPMDLTGEAAGILPPLPLMPVGSYPPNQLGLYDMRGNVWEWTADWFDRDYYGRSSEIDPQGPAQGYLKVVRGSDWRFVGETCRHDYVMLPPWKPHPLVGFRVVCEQQARSIAVDGG